MLYLCCMCRKVLYFVLIFPISLFAQFDHSPVFPDKEGSELFQLLVDGFKPQINLTYGEARDTMFRYVFNENDTIYGVYTRFGKYLDPAADPTSFLFDDGGSLSINTEHTYPQSKGASQGPARSDIHNLFPCKTPVNSARGSDIFGENNDNQVSTWYYKDLQSNQIPSNNIDAYSEYINGSFEPREEHKGNVARAMFYFYTMYRNEAMTADPDFFDLQKETLCDWHYLDPVDQQEWDRTFIIAKYQDDKTNPFVLDCSLAARMYCPEDAGCKVVDTNDPIEDKFSFSSIENSIFLNANVNGQTTLSFELTDMSGKQLFAKNIHITNGRNLVELNQKLSSGIYITSLRNENRIIHIQKLMIK